MNEIIQKKLNKNYVFLRRTLQLVFSVSVFSLFVWYCSGFSILPQSFNAYFSTCLLSMLTHTLERKYMFLICNGILAFLAKNSLLKSSPTISAFEIDIEFQASNLSETKKPVAELEALEQVEKQEEYYEQLAEDEEQEEDQTRGRENEAAMGGEDEEEGTGTGTGSEVILKEDDEIEETTMAKNEELENTDELNRKFEEFIRKMKEEIRIEAQRQPVAV